jgi:hypothetical protein
MSYPFPWQIIQNLLARFTAQAAAGKTPMADDNGKLDESWLPPRLSQENILPTASETVKGGIKIGGGLYMDGDTLKNYNPTPYGLPTASASVLGGVKVGSGLSISGGVLSALAGSTGSVGSVQILSPYQSGSTMYITVPSGGTWVLFIFYNSNPSNIDGVTPYGLVSARTVAGGETVGLYIAGTLGSNLYQNPVAWRIA